MAGLFEEDYQAVLKALGARQSDTATGDRAGRHLAPSVLDVAGLLEPSLSTVPSVTAPETPELPPPWSGTLRLMDFDMPRVSRQFEARSENE